MRLTPCMASALCVLWMAPGVRGEDPGQIAQRHFQAGLAYERLGRLEESYTELQLACALQGDNAPMALALGIAASRLGRYAEAQRALERSIVLDANSIASYYELALLYEALNLPDRGRDAWRRFAELSQTEELKLVAQKHIKYLETHDRGTL